MFAKDKIALVQSSAECSTSIADGGNTFSSKHPKAQLLLSCKASMEVKSFYLMRRILVQRLGQIKISKRFRSYIKNKKAKQGIYPITIYLDYHYIEDTIVEIYGNFSSPSWTVY